MSLAEQIERLYLQQSSDYSQEHFDAFHELKLGLNDGTIRSAEQADGHSPSGWKVNAWVKMGILLGFRIGELADMAPGGHFPYYDKSTYPLKDISIEHGIRIVPGGSSIRDGCFIGRGVTCMPPMFVNVGAYVGNGSMIDSHALVGSCAQIGQRVHLSAASQVGGVLEPVGAFPVIVEDDVLIGGNCGIYEGTVIKHRAVIGSGTILNGSTPVYDLVHGKILRREGYQPLVIPPNAVVVPGSRTVSTGWGKQQNISLYTPVIIKYRDSKTDQSVHLEDLLR